MPLRRATRYSGALRASAVSASVPPSAPAATAPAAPFNTVRRVRRVSPLSVVVILSPMYVIVYVGDNLTAPKRAVKPRQRIGSVTAWPSSPGCRLIPIARRIVGRMSTERSG
jgi:hypothetical protein